MPNLQDGNSETDEIIRADSGVKSQHGSISQGCGKSSYREDERDDISYYSDDNQTFDQHLTDEYFEFW